MPTLKFTDGMSINTDGEYRVIRERDGLYVVGHGFMSAVETHDEGRRLIAELTVKKEQR